MSRKRIFSSATVVSILVASVLMAAPASATTIDVAGYRLNFDNAVDQDILENAQLNSSYLYENIATVSGVEIDAEVTVIAMSDNSLGNYPHEGITDVMITALNLDNPSHVDVAGCYSTQDYVTAYEGGAPYDFLGFNAPGALKGGVEVAYIDEYEDDVEWEHAINTGLDLCDPGYTSEVDGFVSINIEFQVDGVPVTLNNVVINATDIDREQEVTFYEPAPTSFRTSGEDSLVTIDDQSASQDFVTFIGSTEPNEEGFEDRYVGEVAYDSVTDFNYTFSLVNGSSGGMSLVFESYFNPTQLADTGSDVSPAGYVAIASLVLGVVAVIFRRVRQIRA